MAHQNVFRRERKGDKGKSVAIYKTHCFADGEGGFCSALNLTNSMDIGLLMKGREPFVTNRKAPGRSVGYSDQTPGTMFYSVISGITVDLNLECGFAIRNSFNLHEHLNRK